MTDLEIYLLTPADYARLVNLILGAACLLGMVVQRRRFLAADRSEMFLRSAVGAFLAFSMVGTWETLTDPDPAPGIRSFLLTLALGWLLLSMWLDRRDNPHRQESHHG